MKKFFTVFFLSFILFFLMFGLSYATEQELCEDRTRGQDGRLQGFVPCGISKTCPCQIGHFFKMIESIYSFIVWYIATPLAVLMLVIGGIMILISAGNPQLAGKGKELVRWAIIGLVLVFCAWLIIQFILTAMGYENIGTWNIL